MRGEEKRRTNRKPLLPGKCRTLSPVPENLTLTFSHSFPLSREIPAPPSATRRSRQFGFSDRIIRGRKSQTAGRGRLAGESGGKHASEREGRCSFVGGGRRHARKHRRKNSAVPSYSNLLLKLSGIRNLKLVYIKRKSSGVGGREGAVSGGGGGEKVSAPDGIGKQSSCETGKNGPSGGEIKV